MHRTGSQAAGNHDNAGERKAEKAWEKSVALLEKEIDPHIFTAYIKPLAIQSFDSDQGILSVQAPSKLVSHHVQENYLEKIKETLVGEWEEVDGLKLKIVCDEGVSSRKGASSQYVVVKKSKSRVKRPEDLKASSSSNLNKKYSFDNFVVGNSNQFCHAAAIHVAEDPGGAYNPLFIYGGVGLGKTHLLHAIGNAVIDRNPSAKVLYMSSETFTNELIQALRFAKMDEFKNRLRGIDVLLIDDIQFMCGKERTQEEFFHTFNALYSLKRQIVLTADKVPQEMPGIEERLQTRFSWGLTADLQSPDFETRAAILRRKAAFDGFQLPVDVAHFIAEKVTSNVRELEGALTRLRALASLKNLPINLELAESALEPLLKARKISVSVDDIKQVVSDHFNIKVSEIISKRRTKNLAFPRHVAMYLCRKHTTASFPEIGNQFGGRDHSSVIHATNVIGKRVPEDQELMKHIQEIEFTLFR